MPNNYGRKSEIRYCKDDCGRWGRFRYRCPSAHGIDMAHVKELQGITIDSYNQIIDQEIIDLEVRCPGANDYRIARFTKEIHFEKPEEE